MLIVTRLGHTALSLKISVSRCSPNGFANVLLQQHRTLLNQQIQSFRTGSRHGYSVPFRKQLKDEAKGKRAAQRLEGQNASIPKGGAIERDSIERWRLTVGLEIHAQLNTECKLFSEARAAHHVSPNTNLAPFDLAFPGSHPIFQQATLIPALRAALGLSCNIQRKSTFDRKHYYYQDQPSGYQITQYYKPFATKGHLTLYGHDGIGAEDGNSVTVGIKQIQLEQDTAKSTLQPPSTALLDFNRVGHPLIEIITLPEIHSPETAAACVKKIQSILQAVNAVTTGMELGGLRADVNVSVSPSDSHYLSQRTEIKNLSSFKAVEDAIIAERDRQIAVLSSGGTVTGETRGWSLGSTETRALRRKEGEVDYRYMPDPDVSPLIIGDDLIAHVSRSLPQLPEEIVVDLVEKSALSIKDAKTLVALDQGERLDYFDQVRILCYKALSVSSDQHSHLDKMIANWILHELGGLLNASGKPFSPDLVPAQSMADLLTSLEKIRITGTTAKQLLSMIFDGDTRRVVDIIQEDNLKLETLSREEYLHMAQNVLEENKTKVKQIQQQGQLGKLQYLVGQMMRQSEGKVQPSEAKAVLKELLGLD